MTDSGRVQCAGLTKAYRLGRTRVPVLHGVHLEVRPRERLCIMGASGSGKSTLLHLLAGLDTPDAGTVTVEGEVLGNASQTRRAVFRARRIGFVFQSYHLMSELTVLENVLLPARAIGQAARRQTRERAASLLDRVGLAHRLQHRPLELSGGEQQRAAIARALINCPGILFADEPTGNLDSKTGNQVLDMLFDAARDEHITLLVVTHNPALAHLCDRTVDLIDGTVRATGS